MTEYDMIGGIFAWFIGVGFLAWLVGVAILIVGVACTWRLFNLAGRPGWLCLIPFLNAIVLCQIVFGDDRWWVLLLAGGLAFIPLIGPLASTALIAYTNYSTAIAYGQSPLMGLLHCFFSPWTMLIWVLSGSARYVGTQPMLF